MARSFKYALAISTLLLTLPAGAVTVTTDVLPNTPAGALPAPDSSNNFLGNLTTSVGGQYLSPWQGTAFPNAEYNSVQGTGAITPGASFAEYLYDTAQTSLRLIWGSPDSYNTLRLYDSANNNFFTIVGNAAAITSTPGYFAGTGFVNVLLTMGIAESFTKVRFESTTNAFEHVFNRRLDVIPPVPVPGALLLLLSGIAGIGLVGRSRAKTVRN